MTRSRQARTAAATLTFAAALCTVVLAPGVASAATAPEYGLSVHTASPQGIEGSGKGAASNAVVSPQGVGGTGKHAPLGVADPQGIQGTGK
ncbi:MAG: hypothetical protein HOW97_39495 [Catenulispora sp.]|nr:hypothetical protein [Catenulispora sp.]